MGIQGWRRAGGVQTLDLFRCQMRRARVEIVAKQLDGLGESDDTCDRRSRIVLGQSDARWHLENRVIMNGRRTVVLAD